MVLQSEGPKKGGGVSFDEDFEKSELGCIENMNVKKFTSASFKSSAGPIIIASALAIPASSKQFVLCGFPGK